METGALTVRQLNFYVKSILEGDSRLSAVCVTGEISNLKSHYASGHLYFTLKDKDASVSCVMYSSYASRVKFELADGITVNVKGRVSLYEKSGQYQLYAEEMTDAGLGDIALKFEQIKKRLAAEGMTDPETKRPLPLFPKKIAVITSESGAAVRDIINIISRRWSPAEIVMCPVSVQGEQAVPDMLDALDRLYRLPGIDVAIIGRGGGSAEDLWAFNNEELARKIYESPFPVISAVGHETDFSICDFVADMRAPTPSAAAELAVPDKEKYINDLEKYGRVIKNLMLSKYENSRLRFEKLSSSPYIKDPFGTLIGESSETVDRLYDRLIRSAEDTIEKRKTSLSENAAKLDGLSPLKVIARGYAAIKKDGCVVSSVENISQNDKIELTLSDGKAECTVDKITGSDTFGR